MARVTLLLLLLGAVTAFVFSSSRPACADGLLCVAIWDCPAYRTREAVLRSRPKPCGFRGVVPLVCCDAGSPAPPRPVTPPPPGPVAPSPGTEATVNVRTNTRLPAPGQCGRPRPSGFLGRRRRSTVPDLPLSYLPVPGEDTDTPSELPSLPNELPGLPTESPDFDLDLELPEPLIQHAVGGYNAGGEKWPWIAVFGRRSEDGLGRWFCGGTLITRRHVLTAAHCLLPGEEDSVGVRIGDVDVDYSFEVVHFETNISSMVRHPDYVGSQNDLAVVTLAEPVPPSEDIEPICLPPAGAEHVGLNAEMAGWGLLEFAGDPSAILQEVPLRVIDPTDCEDAYRSVRRFFDQFPGGFQGTKVCAASRDDEPRDACEGDSGGPLSVELEDGTYQLVGVVAVGLGCGNPDYPGIYTKVSAYIDWITDQLI